MNIIQKLGDSPNTDNDLNADQLKAEFDKGGNLLKTFINNMIDKLNQLVEMLNNSTGGSILTGGSMLGSLNMNGQSIYGLDVPSSNDEAANKKYVDEAKSAAVSNAVSSAVYNAKTYTDGRFSSQSATLYYYNWSSNLQTVSVPGVTSDTSKTDVIVSCGTSDSDWETYTECGIRAYSQGSGTVTFKCSEKPSDNVTVNILVRRAAE